MSAEYDTPEGIRRYLDGPDTSGLLRLIKDRSEAGYKRRERLKEFIILGRFHVDTCGNFSVCSFGYDFGAGIGWLSSSLPQVLPMEDLRRVLTKLTVTSHGYRPPSPDDRCNECGEGWSLADCHDSIHIRSNENDSIRFEHILCRRLRIEREDMRWYQKAACEAGLEQMVFVPVPNGYVPGADEASPWCKVKTPKGDITFGWRKRVVSIEWSDMVERRLCKARMVPGWKEYEMMDAIRKELDSDTLFPNEDVTKGPTYIHAWGKEKLVEYLVRISKAVGLKVKST